VLGATSLDAIEIVATTVTVGDPSYAGPLAGVSLSLPVYHVLEPEISAAVPREAFATHLAMFDLIADREAIRRSMETFRRRSAAPMG
jgi:glycine/sarcosine/betaine reductase complex component A